MCLSCFQDHFFDESKLSRFDKLTKPNHKYNEDRHSYATQYQGVFKQYTEVFNFFAGKPSH